MVKKYASQAAGTSVLLQESLSSCFESVLFVRVCVRAHALGGHVDRRASHSLPSPRLHSELMEFEAYEVPPSARVYSYFPEFLGVF